MTAYTALFCVAAMAGVILGAFGVISFVENARVRKSDGYESPWEHRNREERS